MGEVIDFPSKDIFYRMENDKIVGVGSDEIYIDNIGNSETQITVYDVIDRSELRYLMIAWLALNYPECLNNE